MKNYKLILQYDGTRYDGWQRQGNTSHTIEEQITFVLSKICGETIELFGSGRTDAGAHAKGQTANFHTSSSIDAKTILMDLNKYLPEDIGILSIEEMPERFHSRLNAKSKKYVYRVWNSPIPNVFERNYMLSVPEQLDLKKMRQAACYLIGSHDFKAFCSNKRYKKSTVRHLYQIDIKQEGTEISMLFHGNGFLYNMVRILSGTLLEVGKGAIEPQAIPVILESLDREKAGPTLPAKGLTLLTVLYE